MSHESEEEKVSHECAGKMIRNRRTQSVRRAEETHTKDTQQQNLQPEQAWVQIITLLILRFDNLRAKWN